MRISSRRRLREFWAAEPRAEPVLRDWYTKARYAVWRRFADVRATFNNADAVGNCTVFNIAGNRYRLIARVIFARRRVYDLRVLTHADYDRIDWAETCGCYRPPPKLGAR